MATGYDKVFEFAPQFGLYQLYLFVCAYFAAGSIYGPFLTASVFFQVSLNWLVDKSRPWFFN